MNRLTLILLLIISVNTYGQIDFKNEIDNTYNFYPHKLSKQEQQEKFPALNSFFEKIKSDTTKYLPLLRKELNSNEHFPYFYYDCSHLLLILSKSKTDKNTAANAFAKSNIYDLDPKTYVTILKSLANEGINTTNAAIKILEDSTFHFYLIEHGGYKFIQGYCLMYCLLPLDSRLYLDTLIKTFQSTKSITAQKSIITTLWFAYSCEGDKFLQSLNETNTLNKDVAEYAHRLLNYAYLDKHYQKLLRKIKPEELVEIKKSALKRFSDEAISELDFVTKANRQKINCQ